MKPKNKRIDWTPLALGDLVEIRDFIHRDKPAAAKKEAFRIQKSVERLAFFPKSGKECQALSGVRQLTSGSYQIFYQVLPSQVVILRIYHGKRRPLEVF